MKVIKLKVTKEVVLQVPQSWKEKELKLLASDLCNHSFDESSWNLANVDFSINSANVEKITTR